MKYPGPLWKDHFDDASWIGLLNWYILRWMWLRLYGSVKDVESMLLQHVGLVVGLRPSAWYQKEKPGPFMNDKPLVNLVLWRFKNS